MSRRTRKPLNQLFLIEVDNIDPGYGNQAIYDSKRVVGIAFWKWLSD